MKRTKPPRLFNMLALSTDTDVHQSQEGGGGACSACVMDYPAAHVLASGEVCGGFIHADRRYDMECGTRVILAKRCDGCGYESFTDTTPEETRALAEEERHRREEREK